MKYVISADIHGSADWCKKLLDAFQAENADKLVLLGDILYHGPRNDFPDGYSPAKLRTQKGFRYAQRHKRKNRVR